MNEHEIAIRAANFYHLFDCKQDQKFGKPV